MEIIFESDIKNYKEKKPSNRFTPKKNWGVFCDVVLSESNLYKPVMGDCIYDKDFNVIYQIIKIVNEKTVTIAPWGADDAINIIPNIGYLISHKRIV